MQLTALGLGSEQRNPKHYLRCSGSQVVDKFLTLILHAALTQTWRSFVELLIIHLIGTRGRT